jgi:hypothetical protein
VNAPAADLCTQIHTRFLEILKAEPFNIPRPDGSLEHVQVNRDAINHFQAAFQGVPKLAAELEDAYADYLAKKGTT